MNAVTTSFAAFTPAFSRARARPRESTAGQHSSRGRSTRLSFSLGFGQTGENSPNGTRWHPDGVPCFSQTAVPEPREQGKSMSCWTGSMNCSEKCRDTS